MQWTINSIFYHFLRAKKTPKNMPYARKPFIIQRETQKIRYLKMFFERKVL